MCVYDWEGGKEWLRVGREWDVISQGGGRDVMSQGRGRDVMSQGGGRDAMSQGRGRDVMEGCIVEGCTYSMI